MGSVTCAVLQFTSVRSQRNKLDLPAAEEAFQRADGEQEIIEEYDEEKETAWREQHRQRVREHKQRERAEREQADSEDAVNANGGAGDEATPVISDNNVLEMLDRLEQLEDLEAEMDSLQADGVSDEQLQQLLSGELTPSSDATATKRVAHQPANVAPAKKEPVRRIPINVNKVPAANMPSLSNYEDSESSDSYDDDGNSLHEDDDDEEDVPEQLRLILLQAYELGTTQNRIRFLRENIREVQLELRAEKAMSSVVDLVSRSDRMFVCERLQREIDRLLADNDKFFFSSGFKMLDADLKQDICRKRQSNIEENEAFKAAFPLVKDEAPASPAAAVELKRSVSFGADEVTSFSKHQAPRRVSDHRRNAQLDSDDLSSSDSDSDSSASDTTTRLAKLVGTMKLTAKVSEGAAAKPILKNKQAVKKERHRSQTVSMSSDESKRPVGREGPATDTEPMVEFNKVCLLMSLVSSESNPWLLHCTDNGRYFRENISTNWRCSDCSECRDAVGDRRGAVAKRAVPRCTCAQATRQSFQGQPTEVDYKPFYMLRNTQTLLRYFFVRFLVYFTYKRNGIGDVDALFACLLIVCVGVCNSFEKEYNRVH